MNTMFVHLKLAWYFKMLLNITKKLSYINKQL